jgi:hypothetical protein
MNDKDRYWLAGLFEGEAYFGTTYDRRLPQNIYPRIELQMTDRDVVEKVSRMLGIVMYETKRRSENRKPTWRVCVTGKKAKQIMHYLMPLMGERRKARILEVLATVTR